MKKNKIIFISLALILLSGIFIFYYPKIIPNSEQNVVCTMDAKLCPDGSYVGRSGPKCEFSECPKTTEKNDLIILEKPQKEETISSPLTVKGRARGNWFFEASFPIFLTDWDGKIIAQTIAKAKGDWMTEDFVPFEAILEFKTPEHISGVKNKGSLILKKDNPSELPENDDALEITVNF